MKDKEVEVRREEEVKGKEKSGEGMKESKKKEGRKERKVSTR